MNLREYERESIRRFVQKAADDGYLSGRVLDYGCGKQPYRDIVEAGGGEYDGYDRQEFGGALSKVGDVGDILVNGYNAVLCTQVVQYMEFPTDEIHRMRNMLLKARGHLVLTYPTSWPEVEADDYHRFTKAGMTRRLEAAGFTIVRHERRGTLYDPRFPSGREKRITALGEEFAIGYGCIARA